MARRTRAEARRDTYWRQARLIEVVDGDTVRLTVDDGRRQFSDEEFRLLHVDCPERRRATMPAWRAARDFTTGWFATHSAPSGTVHTVDAGERWPVRMRTEKSDSFDRWLAEVECTCGASLNQALLDSRNAVPRDGRSFHRPTTRRTRA